MRCITFNLGCGGPHTMAREAEARAWIQDECEGYDLLFLQEVPSMALVAPVPKTHAVFTVEPPRYRCRSAILARPSLGAQRFTFQTADYHDSYVAAVTLPKHGGLVCMSVHASPSRVTPEWRSLWRSCSLPLPDPREDVEDLWDSDLLLDTSRRVGLAHPTVVAGDWNEARNWDCAHDGEPGEHFFDAVKRAQLTDCTLEQWGQEHPTCFAHDTTQLQVDHVFATADVAARVEISPSPPVRVGGFDHAAIVFEIH